MKNRTGLLTDSIYLEHDTGLHPENKNRLKVILDYLPTTDLWNSLQLIPAEKAAVELIEMVHDSDYIASLKRQIDSGAACIGSMDCIVSKKTFEVAQYAVGGAVALTKLVSSGAVSNGFGLIRPPGHHAEKDQAMGFCFFNNIAVCAEYLIQKENYSKILIVDFDVHHGNGTQHFFESRKDVFYCSIHEDPDYCYPGTGYANERGVGEGEGYTLNVPMAVYSGDANYVEMLQQKFLPAWKKFSPDFVLISAGFDAHVDDTLAGISVTEKTFREYTNRICHLAKECCNGKVVSLLEGGYNLKNLPRLVEVHLRELVNAAMENAKK